MHAFAHDMKEADPERVVFHESHVGFYYKKYFKKDLSMKYYNCSNLTELLNLIPDIIEVNSNKTLGGLLSDDSPMDNFVRLTEESRRERQKLIDAGDESAVLKFSQRQVSQDQRGGKGAQGGKGPKTDRSAYGKQPKAGAAPAGRPGLVRSAPLSRATYGAAPAIRSGYGGPPGMHGPPMGMHGPPPGMYGPPPGYGMPPPGYGMPPPGYGMPPPGARAYGGPPPGGAYGPGPAGPQGLKRGGYGAGPAGGMPPSKQSRGAYGGGRR